MKYPGIFNGDAAIAFWTGLYMTVTGCYVRPPLDPPATPNDLQTEALPDVKRESAEVESAA